MASAVAIMTEKPGANPRNSVERADNPPIIRSRSLPAIGAGLLALVGALLAVVTDQAWLVIVAALLASVSVAIVLQWHHWFLNRWSRRADLTAEAEHLAHEHEQALARAARFEAEAIAARAQLAEAMRNPPAAPLRHDPATASVESVEEPAPAPAPTPVTPHGSATDPPPESVDLITDPTTGLFSQVFFDASLVKRISAARRGLRPLSMAVADVVVGVGAPGMSPAPPAPVAATMVTVFREADTLARSSDGLFLILLEDTPENGAVWTLERLRRRIAEDLPGHTLWVGLSCYPAYGFDADQLTAQARSALAAAREWQQDRIEVTTAAPEG